jgi:hypothetical protein
MGMDRGSSVQNKNKNGARNQSKTKGYQINGEEYKHLQRIAKHFVKERLILNIVAGQHYVVDVAYASFITDRINDRVFWTPQSCMDPLWHI